MEIYHMEDIKNVLLVTNNVTEDEVNLIKTAIENVNLTITLSLVHVIPNLPTCYFNIPSMITLAEQYYTEAKSSLTNIGEKLIIPKKNQWLITGRIKSEVLRLAGKLNTNYILASSTNIQDIYKTFAAKSERKIAQVRSVHHINKLMNQLTFD